MTKKIIIFVLGIVAIGFTFVYFLLITTVGSSFVIKWAVLMLGKAESIQFEKVDGSFINRVTLENVRIRGLQGLPKDSDVTFERIYISLKELSKDGLCIDISRGSLILPNSEPVYFSGKLERNFIDLTINSSMVNFRQLSQLLPDIKVPQSVSGNFKELKLQAGGSLEEQTIQGSFIADNIVYEDYILNKGYFYITASTRLFKELASMKGLITIDNMEVGLNAAVQSTANIQKTGIVFDIQHINALDINVFNGRLSLSGSDPILFHGNYTSGLLNFNFYSKRTNVENLLFVLDIGKTPISLKGSFADIDFNLKGAINEFVLQGTAFAEKLNYEAFSLSDTPFVYDVILKESPKGFQINGSVIAKNGVISGPGTAVVYLEESQLIYSGDPQKPGLNIKGVSKVEKTKIKIVLKGTMEKPDLRLSSEPSLPQERLLVMLTTGKKWKGADTLFSKGVVSPDLAMDFVDYFVFGGSGSKIADKFGITGLSVQLDKTTKGIELSKSVSDKAEVGYGVLQKQSNEKALELNQKISGAYNITDTIAVSAEREFKQASTPGQSPEEQKTDDKVMIKYRRKF